MNSGLIDSSKTSHCLTRGSWATTLDGGVRSALPLRRKQEHVPRTLGSKLHSPEPLLSRHHGGRSRNGGLTNALSFAVCASEQQPGGTFSLNSHPAACMRAVHVCMLRRVRLFATPRTVARQAPVHGPSWVGILQQVAISSSKGSSPPRDRTHVSCIGRWILYH